MASDSQGRKRKQRSRTADRNRKSLRRQNGPDSDVAESAIETEEQSQNTEHNQQDAAAIAHSEPDAEHSTNDDLQHSPQLFRKEALRNIAQFRSSPSRNSQMGATVASEMEKVRHQIKHDLINHEKAVNPFKFVVCSSCGIKCLWINTLIHRLLLLGIGCACCVTKPNPHRCERSLDSDCSNGHLRVFRFAVHAQMHCGREEPRVVLFTMDGLSTSLFLMR